MPPDLKTMRDAMIERVAQRMAADPSIFFLTADLGAPALDRIRADFPQRFVNVGIAEQNLVNVSTGLALEGYTVFALAIAPFLSMRCFEQIRNNLALQAQVRPANVNLLAVGAGFSYEVSGPTHHAPEDLSLLRTLPNVMLFSPSDWRLAARLADYAMANRSPKYFRLEGKAFGEIGQAAPQLDVEAGARELMRGDGIALVTTGSITQRTLRIAERLREQGVHVGVIDLFMLNPVNEAALLDLIRTYRHIVSVEEGFVGKGGLDSLLALLLTAKRSAITLTAMGLRDRYCYEMGSREHLYELNGLGDADIVRTVQSLR